MKMRRMIAAGMALTMAVGALAACGDDDDSAATPTKGTDDFASVVQASIDAENAKDYQSFLALWTDKGLESYDSGTREEIAAGKGDLSGDIDVQHLGDAVVHGDTASVEVDATADEQKAFVQAVYRVVFTGVKKDGRWLIDGFDFKGSPPPSAEAEVVHVTAKDYEFHLDRDAVPAGEVAFRFANEGKEQHEIALYKAPDGVTVEQAKAAVENVNGEELEDVPDGYEVAHVAFADVGQSMDVTFADDLGAGTYVLVCYIPQGGFGEHGPVDPNGRPHVQLGMIHLLTVTS
jgi:plastocyanin